MKDRSASPWIRSLAASAAVMMAGSLAACSSSGGGSASSGSAKSTAKVASIAAMLPASIAKKGTLTVAAATYPPAVIQPAGGGEPTGWDVENTRQIAAVLGLKVTFKIIPFDGVITGLAAGRYDAATGEIYVTPERTKQVTFVTNHVSSDALEVRSDSKITSAPTMDSLCGQTIAAELGSAEAALATKIASHCKSAGKSAVTTKTFNAQAEVNLALGNGRIDAAVSSASQVAYALSQTGSKFKLVELPWAPKYNTGLALARNADVDQFAKAVKAATDYLIKTGALKQILAKSNDGQGLIKAAQVLPASA